MMHKARMSRREFLATSAATAAGIVLSQDRAAGGSDTTQPCSLIEIPTGFEQLDGLTGGLHRSELVLLASRPGMGKTALALNITDFAGVVAGTPTLYISLGTSSVEIGRRLLCSRGQVDQTAMRHRTLSAEVGCRVTQAAAEISTGPLYIDDQPLRTAAEIRTLVERFDEHLMPEDRLGLVVVDHLQRVEAEYPIRTVGKHFTEVAHELRNLARDMNVAVLCLVQLNGRPSIDADTRVALGELRGTQHAADTIMLLQCPGCYLVPSETQKCDPESKAQLSAIRRRDRLAKTVELSWNSHYERFSESAVGL